MPAFESRRVRTHPRTVTSLSTATRPLEYVGYRHNAHNILSVNSRKKINTCPPVNGGGDTYVTASAIRQAEFANAAKDFGIKGKKKGAD